MADARRTTPRFAGFFDTPVAGRRASVVIPFIVISIALGVLAWRSYHLSVRMERGLDSLAVQYLGYAAEMTARRADASVGSAMLGAWEQWQEIERGLGDPQRSDLQQWMARNPWIVSAIYLADHDPENAMFVNEGELSAGVLQHEFFTSDGTIRYYYDPGKLLAHASEVVRQDPPLSVSELTETMRLPAQSRIELVRSYTEKGLVRTPDGFAVIVPLGAPLERSAVRASVNTSYFLSGWENHRILSLLFAAIAFTLLAAGAFLAIRGFRREYEAMQLRAALIANVSHELRTPLSMIRLGAETMKRSTKLRPEDRASLEDSILREVIHLSHLVENVLDVARLQKGGNPPALTPVHPDELIYSLLNDYGSWIESKGFELDADVGETVDEQLWDREAVSRALLNLIDNAVKYSSTEKKIHVSLLEGEQEVRISVRDHGLGIPQKQLQRIFEPYYRATFSDTQTRRGAGLGLTLVQQIMRSHGGRVDVESTPGEGSTFTLVFPRRKTQQPESASALEIAPGMKETA